MVSATARPQCPALTAADRDRGSTSSGSGRRRRCQRARRHEPQPPRRSPVADPRLLRLYPMNLVARAIRPAGPVDRANLFEGHCTTPERRASRSPRSPKMRDIRARVLSVSHLVLQDASTNGTLHLGLTTTPAWATRNEKLGVTPGGDDPAE